MSWLTHFIKNTASFPSTSLCQNLLFISLAYRCVCGVYIRMHFCMYVNTCMYVCVCWPRVDVACQPWSLKFIYCGRVFCWSQSFLIRATLASQPALGFPCLCLLSTGVTGKHHVFSSICLVPGNYTSSPHPCLQSKISLSIGPSPHSLTHGPL